MRRLLMANLKRLMKSKWFWLAMVVMAGYSLCGIISEIECLPNGIGSGAADEFMVNLFEILDYVAAVFISLFIGVEYSNKTIRNKIIAGHSKVMVYFSNFITCSIAVLLMYCMVFIVYIVIGIPVLGPFAYQKRTLVFFLSGILTVVAKVSIMVLISMLITREAICMIVAMLIMYMSTLMVVKIEMRLDEPQMEIVHQYDEYGNFIGEEIVENDFYISSKSERTFLEHIMCFIPNGQYYSYLFTEPSELPKNIEFYPFYSIVLCTITTGCGIMIFKRKDLK